MRLDWLISSLIHNNKTSSMCSEIYLHLRNGSNAPTHSKMKKTDNAPRLNHPLHTRCRFSVLWTLHPVEGVRTRKFFRDLAILWRLGIRAAGFGLRIEEGGGRRNKISLGCRKMTWYRDVSGRTKMSKRRRDAVKTCCRLQVKEKRVECGNIHQRNSGRLHLILTKLFATWNFKDPPYLLQIRVSDFLWWKIGNSDKIGHRIRKFDAENGWICKRRYPEWKVGRRVL